MSFPGRDGRWCFVTPSVFVGGPAADHDRGTGAPDRVTGPGQGRSPAVLESALRRLRLEGAVFLRAEYREPWAYESLTAPETAKIAHTAPSPGHDPDLNVYGRGVVLWASWTGLR